MPCCNHSLPVGNGSTFWYRITGLGGLGANDDGNSESRARENDTSSSHLKKQIRCGLVLYSYLWFVKAQSRNDHSMKKRMYAIFEGGGITEWVNINQRNQKREIP